jgi:hypothetical protein
VEGIEHVVPSLVWRETFDDRAVPIRKPLYLFQSAIQRIDEIIDAPADGKIRVFAVREAVASGQSYRENIEAAADAVDDDSGFNVDDRWDVNGGGT